MTDFEHDAGGKFPWGKVSATHHIGPYHIIEYANKRDGTTSYHPYVDMDTLGNDTRNGYDTLEHAIVGAIAYKFDGINSHAAHYFMKMIKEEPS